MGSSRCRRMIRAVWYPRTQISTTTRRIALAPVWGVFEGDSLGRNRRSFLGEVREKASRGAERSLRKRKSRRGLRRGKARSRGGKPRSRQPPPATVDTQHIGRKVRRLLRQHAYWDAVVLRFENEFKAEIEKRWVRSPYPHPLVKLESDPWGRRADRVVLSGFCHYWWQRYRRLLKAIAKTDKSYCPLGWWPFLDSRLGFHFPLGERGEASTALEDLAFRAGEAALAHRRSNQTLRPGFLTSIPEWTQSSTCQWCGLGPRVGTHTVWCPLQRGLTAFVPARYGGNRRGERNRTRSNWSTPRRSPSESERRRRAAVEVPRHAPPSSSSDRDFRSLF